jgi:hypothetical protein
MERTEQLEAEAETGVHTRPHQLLSALFQFAIPTKSFGFPPLPFTAVMLDAPQAPSSAENLLPELVHLAEEARSPARLEKRQTCFFE